MYQVFFADRQYILDMVNMRYAMHLNSYQQYVKTTIAMDVSRETAAAIEEQKSELDGVDISEDSVRKYTDSEAFSSILGYTGQISEAAYDDVLRGTNGETTFYVDNLGNVTETVSTTEPTAGNDLYLTIDSDLQKNIYQLMEEKLAGIILSHLENTLTYDASVAEDSSDIIIPVGDAYYSFIGNYIIDYTEFGDEDAGDAEKEIYEIFSEKRESVCSQILDELNSSSAAAYEDLSEEMQSYTDYICNDLLRDTAGIIESESVDTEDETYMTWADQGSISLYEYLHYAISRNWIDTSVLSGGNYSSSEEIYQEIVEYIEDSISENSALDKLIYEELIKAGTVTGAQICAAAYEQGVLDMNEELYNALCDGTLSAYTWLCDRIENLEITPGQLALEPCSGGAVVTDPDTGDVLACVSYPGYDGNRLANTMDTEYYNQLLSGMNNIFYNRATQEKTAPGSTFKMVTAVANRGTVYSLTLVDRITDSEGNLVRENEADIVSAMDEVSDSTWDLVQNGMVQMVENSATFDEIDFSMAGKTGTAQQSSLHPDHALFVGYAPADDPEIAVAVRITYGYSSSYAAEIGRDIAKIWFEPDKAADVLTGNAAELGTALSGD